jgi:hypothetical protein
LQLLHWEPIRDLLSIVRTVSLSDVQAGVQAGKSAQNGAMHVTLSADQYQVYIDRPTTHCCSSTFDVMLSDSVGLDWIGLDWIEL